MDEIISLHSSPVWRIPAARWFQEKWEIPLEEYLTSIAVRLFQSTDYLPLFHFHVLQGQGCFARQQWFFKIQFVSRYRIPVG